MVQEDGFASLSDRQFTLSRNGASEVRQVESPAAYAELLNETFGITLGVAEAARLPIFR